MKQFVDNESEKKYKLILNHQEISYLLDKMDGKGSTTLRNKLQFAVEIEAEK